MASKHHHGRSKKKHVKNKKRGLVQHIRDSITGIGEKGYDFAHEQRKKALLQNCVEEMHKFLCGKGERGSMISAALSLAKTESDAANKSAALGDANTGRNKGKSKRSKNKGKDKDQKKNKKKPDLVHALLGRSNSYIERDIQNKGFFDIMVDQLVPPHSKEYHYAHDTTEGRLIVGTAIYCFRKSLIGLRPRPLLSFVLSL